MNILVLITDAYGGKGGIAEFNRNLIEALTLIPEVRKVVVLPRNIELPIGELPKKLNFVSNSSTNKISYIGHSLLANTNNFELVICGHVNLLPIAQLTQVGRKTPVILITHGIEVWKPTNSSLIRHSLRNITSIWSVSEFTKNKFISWSGIPETKFSVIPNTIRIENYGIKERNINLAKRFNILDSKTILFLGRLSASERYKGVDEIIEAMPDLLTLNPEIKFLIAGDGDDRSRLEVKASKIGVGKNVIFAGYIEDEIKADLYRLADVFAMPGYGEGFGIVYLEALACGIPVIGSKLDGSQEALRNGELGELVNPNVKYELVKAITKQLSAPKGIPEGLEFFSFPEFKKRIKYTVLKLTTHRS